MNKQAMKKNHTLWIALAATLGATAWMAINDKSEPEVLVAKTRRAAVVEPTRQRNSVQVRPAQSQGRVVPNGSAEGSGSLGLISWQRPKIAREPLPLFSANMATLVTSPKDQPSSTPQMPVLPFIYAGKLIDEGRYTVFLLVGERSLAVHRGDVVDEVWRVHDIRPPKMIFKYLPLKLETVMDIGESK